MVYKEAKLFIESSIGVVTIDGYAEEDSHWNGWSYVLMNKTNALKLADKLKDVIKYDEAKDEFVEVFDENHHESEEDLIHWTSFNQEGIHEKVYSIGSGYWTWNHEFLGSEFNNMHNALKEFVKAADKLVDNWDNEYPTVFRDRQYPDYLPSFDEFVMDMRNMILPEDDKRLEDWRRDEGRN